MAWGRITIFERDAGTPTANAFAWLVISILILVLPFKYYLKAFALDWPSTSGVLTSFSEHPVATRRASAHKFACVYTFTVGAVQYTGDRVGRFQDDDVSDEWFKQHNSDVGVGKAVTVRYDSSNPADSFAELPDEDMGGVRVCLGVMLASGFLMLANSIRVFIMVRRGADNSPIITGGMVDR